MSNKVLIHKQLSKFRINNLVCSDKNKIVEKTKRPPGNRGKIDNRVNDPSSRVLDYQMKPGMNRLTLKN